MIGAKVMTWRLGIDAAVNCAHLPPRSSRRRNSSSCSVVIGRMGRLSAASSFAASSPSVRPTTTCTLVGVGLLDRFPHRAGPGRADLPARVVGPHPQQEGGLV